MANSLGCLIHSEYLISLSNLLDLLFLLFWKQIHDRHVFLSIEKSRICQISQGGGAYNFGLNWNDWEKNIELFAIFEMYLYQLTMADIHVWEWLVVSFRIYQQQNVHDNATPHHKISNYN